MAWLCLGLSAACGGDRTVEFSDTRSTKGTLELSVGDAERHGFRTQAPTPAARPAGELSYLVPDEWSERPAGRFHLASFAAPGGVEVSLSRAGGSVNANLDRWRGQLGLGRLDRETFDALERRSILGIESLLVDFAEPEGAGGAGVAPRRLLGAVIPGRFHVFVKMTGTAEAVVLQEKAFSEFLDGLRRSDAVAAGPMGESSRPQTASAGDVAGAAETRSGRLSWSLPTGWEPGRSTSTMRLATFHPGGDTQVQAYLVILSGAAGGDLANLRRWNGQVGLPGPTQQEFDGLRRIPLLGTQAPLLESFGSNQGVVGTLAPLGGNSLFVKMVGPTDRVRQYTDELVAFCESLEVAR